MKTFSVIVAGIVFPLAAAAGAQAGWSFEGLGTLGGDSSRAYAVSADGSVVVGMSEPDSVSAHHPFRWENGVMVDIGSVPDVIPDGIATGVSADGSVVVGWLNGSHRIAFRWEDGEMVDLSPSWPGYPYYSTTHAFGISADGTVVVGHSMRMDPRATGTMYDTATSWYGEDNRRRHLGTLGSETSYAYGVSADGSVVVGQSANAAGTSEAFRWESGTMVGLGTLGGDESLAKAVSADGSIVVGHAYNLDVQYYEAFRWEDGAMVGLGDLGGGTSSARAISLDGAWIVGSSSIGEGQGEAFLWNEADGIRSIPQVLTDHGVDLTGWNVYLATGISADGRVIVGNGIDPDGHRRGWIATIPEPSTLILLLTLAATTALCRVMRRKRTTAQKP